MILPPYISTYNNYRIFFRASTHNKRKIIIPEPRRRGATAPVTRKGKLLPEINAQRVLNNVRTSAENHQRGGLCESTNRDKLNG
jgi:hypothetical protein